MGLGPADVTGAVAGYVTDVFENVGPLAVGETAKVVRDGVPVPGYIVPAIGVEVARRACRRYADNAALFDGASAAQFENLCRPYLDDVGYGLPPSIELPLRGGQCVGVLYRVEFSATQDNGNRFTVEQEVGGPVRGTYVGPADGLGRRGVGIVASDGAGNPVQILQITVNDPATNPAPSVAILRRVDNLADNCGNPPPVVTDPVPPPVPDPPGPAPFNPGTGVDIDINVDIDLTGPTGPTIVFDIGTGPITIDPFGGGGDGGGDGPGEGAPGSGLPPGDIGSPAAPEDTGEDGVAAGCAPPNSVLVGIKVNILTVPEFSSEYDPLVRRGVCYAYMGTIGNLALEPSGVALRDGQMIFAPLDNLTCYEVRANTGYQLRVTPYYRALEPEEV